MNKLHNDFKVKHGFFEGIDLRQLRISDLDELETQYLRKVVDYVFLIIHGHGFKEGEEYGKELKEMELKGGNNEK